VLLLRKPHINHHNEDHIISFLSLLLSLSFTFSPDRTVVTGDSLGGTQFWDGVFGTLIKRFAAHRADVVSNECP
jgi:hypothetical protein